MKRFIKIAMLLCTIPALLGALSITAVAAIAAPASRQISQNRFSPNACGKWSVVPSPNPNTTSILSTVATVSATDAWAVGGSGSQRSTGQTLIEHWDGAHWQIVTSPNPGSRYNTLYGVSAVSASDVWAVGFYVNDNNPGLTLTLIEHWNGSSWSVVTSPSPATINNELLSVTAISASDMWAVGFSSYTTTNLMSVDRALIEHWNGSSWSVVTSANPGSSSDHLSGVATVSSTNVWAVGNYANNDGSGGTLIEHWNGSSWSVTKSPSPGSGGELRAVAAVSASDVWTVGDYDNGGSVQNLIEQWNGTSWQVVKSPNTGTSDLLIGVAAISSSDAWTVGSSNQGGGTFKTLTEQWNGTHWSIVKSPSPGSLTQLLGVAAVSPTNVWAVGATDGNTLIEHYHC